MEFKDSQTYKNLGTAFSAELLAASKYKLYAENAEENDKVHIARKLETNAVNELAHAEIWYKLLNCGKEISVVNQLKAAADDERKAWSEMYKRYARTARHEGYEQIAKLFEGVGSIEYRHDKELTAMIQAIEQGKGLCKPEETIWVCTNCGTLYKAKCAPSKCPVCGYPQGYFEVFCGK